MEAVGTTEKPEPAFAVDLLHLHGAHVEGNLRQTAAEHAGGGSVGQVPELFHRVVTHQVFGSAHDLVNFGHLHAGSNGKTCFRSALTELERAGWPPEL